MIGFMGILGRDGSDPTFLIPDRQCREAYNVDFFQSSCGRRRGGATSVFANKAAYAMYRHVPADDQTAAELWWVDLAGVIHRYAGGVETTPTMVDAMTGPPQETYFQTFNGKLFISYKSAHNRLHVWAPGDPTLNTVIRRVGLDLPPVATLSGLAGGAVTDTRKYRVAWTVQTGGITIRRSNMSVASASQALAAQQITVTRGAAPGEGETHWELYAASTTSAFGDYRLLGTVVIATTTQIDNTTPLPAQVSPADGANTPPPSAKYLSADDARILMTGAWEVAANIENAMAPKTSRIWWTSILGASDVGDDERVSNTGTINSYADVDESTTGISQPMQAISTASTSLDRGSFYAFSYNGVWKFISTGLANAPYLRFRITGGGGAIHHKTIITATDDNGSPSVYYRSRRGMMRITEAGQQYIDEDNFDVITGINLDATVPAFCVFHETRHQIWCYIATGTNLYPNQRLVFDVRLGRISQSAGGVRQGWALHEGEQTKAYCGCLFSDTIGATVGRALKPYIGYSGADAIWKCDTADMDDAGNTFQAYIESKSYAPWGIGRKGGLKKEAILVAQAAPGIAVQLTIYRDEGAETMISLANLTPMSDTESETRVFPIFEDSKLADSNSIRVRIGDATAIAASWNIDGVLLPTEYQGER